MNNRFKMNVRRPYFVASSFITLVAFVIFLTVKILPLINGVYVEKSFYYLGGEIIISCEQSETLEDVQVRAKQSFDALIEGIEPIIEIAVGQVSSSLNEANQNNSLPNFEPANTTKSSMMTELLSNIRETYKCEIVTKVW